MNADTTLTAIRHYVRTFVDSGDPKSAAHTVDLFRDLDAHLTAGGPPPEAWREGPDAPADDQFLRIEFALPVGAPDWQHWADEPASQVLTELREAFDNGRYRVRALDSGGMIVAELNPRTEDADR